ncbi:MAG: hypothetical protein QOI98_421 [Solirubrobacteraceae bacterium]|nr:hypothetical protein [Solirubrobacteraceae bacterium]
MLFDLRGRGRRRTIQGIYLTLAVLMGGGLVLFGIGGATSGGLLDALKSNGGGSGSTSGNEKQIAAAEKRTRLQPRNPAVWLKLADLRVDAARLGGNFDQTKLAFTAKGKAELTRAANAWQRYLALKPKKPDPDVASKMVQAYLPTGINQPEKVVEAEEIVVDSEKPNANLFATLAVYAYLAGQERKGDLAAAKAVSLTPKADRATFKQQLADEKTQAMGQTATPQTTTTPPTATTG